MTIVLIAVVFYVVATALLVKSVAIDRDGGRLWLLPAILAVLAHGGYHLWVALRSPGGADMHFFAALSLVGLGMALYTTDLGVRGRAVALGAAVFPLAALLLLSYGLYGHEASPPLDWRLQLHAWLALLAFATLGVSALLALMLWVQERALRQHRLRTWLHALPPLTELETLMFRGIAAGFVLLTATLLTGVLFVENLLAQHLAHKTVFSVLSWLVFGGLLWGRFRYGWRGMKAVHLTLLAMFFLILAFFGSKFVLELILHRN
jgi:ABC-type uncharacterized transport system permease subunit